MNSVKIKIGKSNINYFENEKIYELTLTKCCGFGSYGFIFKTNVENYVIKILLDPEETYDVKYSDYYYLLFHYNFLKFFDDLINIPDNYNNYDELILELFNIFKYPETLIRCFGERNPGTKSLRGIFLTVDGLDKNKLFKYKPQ